jgi:hypothetical protein
MWQTLIRLRKIWSEKRRALLSNNFHLISFNLYPDVKWSLLLWSAAFQDQIDYQTIHSSCSYSEFSPFLKVFKGNVKSLYRIMYTPSCSRGKSAQLRSRLQFRWSIDVENCISVRVVPKSGLVFDAGLLEVQVVTGQCSDRHIAHGKDAATESSIFQTRRILASAYFGFCRNARA